MFWAVVYISSGPNLLAKTDRSDCRDRSECGDLRRTSHLGALGGVRPGSRGHRLVSRPASGSSRPAARSKACRHAIGAAHAVGHPGRLSCDGGGRCGSAPAPRVAWAIGSNDWTLSCFRMPLRADDPGAMLAQDSGTGAADVGLANPCKYHVIARGRRLGVVGERRLGDSTPWRCDGGTGDDGSLQL